MTPIETIAPLFRALIQVMDATLRDGQTSARMVGMAGAVATLEAALDRHLSPGQASGIMVHVRAAESSFTRELTMDRDFPDICAMLYPQENRWRIDVTRAWDLTLAAIDGRWTPRGRS